MVAKIAVIYYSTYGHLYKMALEEVAGAQEVEGVEVTLLQIPEILPEEVLAKMHAAPKADVPVADVHDITQYDGFIFGFPTRYGSPAAQFKAFWDATGQLWQKGSLVGKAVTTFVGTGTQGGGQETTHLVSLTNFVHHGMIYIPPGYSFGPQMFGTETAQGGSPYGAGLLAGGDGSRQPSEHELAYAKHQGKYFAGVVKKLATAVA
jgi:NAD(P)H dehydrogenase (quinone)